MAPRGDASTKQHVFGGGRRANRFVRLPVFVVPLGQEATAGQELAAHVGFIIFTVPTF